LREKVKIIWKLNYFGCTFVQQNKQSNMKTNTQKKIDTGLIPHHYLPEVDGDSLSLHIPAYVGINIESITDIEESDVSVRIYTRALVITLWKQIYSAHITIF
jgi:hypothetical protein